MKGYKGFKKDLSCLGYQYTLGQIHEETGVRLCNRGFHFCERLTDVFKYYSRESHHIFGIVESHGKVEKGEDKSCTEKIEVIRILSDAEIDRIVEREKRDLLDDVFHLDLVSHLQSKYNCIIGGSIALYLHGFDLDRYPGMVDLDVIMPYFQQIEEDDYVKSSEFTNEKSSGNDYGTTEVICTKKGPNVKMDLRIDSAQRYETVVHKGKKYKVTDLMTILEAKCRYAKKGDAKHRKDIMTLLSKNKVNNDDVFEV